MQLPKDCHGCLNECISLLCIARNADRVADNLRAGIFAFEKKVKEMIHKKWSHIMIHHSLTPDGATVSWQAIRRYHINDNHWADIGYHFGIELVNSDYEILIGCDLDSQGAHCPQGDMNRKALGICFVGNYDIDAMPPALWTKGLHLIAGLMRILDIPLPGIVGHRDYNPNKSCPGIGFDLDKFRADLGELL